MEQNQWSNPRETRGWEIVKRLNEVLAALGNNSVAFGGSLDCRKLLAEYFKLDTGKPSRLHSAILSCAAKMATAFPDFHFVPFLEMWGIENLRPEDSETKVSDDGKRFPSLGERMTKAYAYSLMFHPGEHLMAEAEQMIKPVLERKGYRVLEKNGRLFVAFPAIATRVFQSEVRNRMMTFVTLLTPSGNEVVCEVHTVTQYRRMPYNDIMNQSFNIVLRTSDKGNLRVEAAFPSKEGVDEGFTTAVGYVEHIDTGHRHIHIYDSDSRHFVQPYSTEPKVQVGSYVRFIPIIPMDSNFKSAVITSVLDNGVEAFGLRNAVVTFTNEEQGYCAWELMPEADGKVRPLVEKDAKEVQEPGTKGYINKVLCERLGLNLPSRGEKLRIVTFLKRGKDRKKRPVVVCFMPIS